MDESDKKQCRYMVGSNCKNRSYLAVQKNQFVRLWFQLNKQTIFNPDDMSSF